MRLTRAVALTAIAVAATSGPLRGQEPPLATVMARVGGYVSAFQQQLSNIVAEERYVQDITGLNLPPGRFAAVSHRELRSDLLLVRPGAGGYVAFRDVFEVDGQPVRDRQDRLTALFLSPTATAEAQIERINLESARYNIGTVERTINTPTLPLLFLWPQNQSRLRFARSTKLAPAIGRAPAWPPDTWVIEYEEIERPTLIRTTRGLDLPARGRFWIEPATGRVLASELVADDAAVRATIDVSYQPDPSVGLLVPAEMRERYAGRRDGAVIEGNATYGKIRQFQVQADERLGRTEPGRIEPVDATAAVPAAPAVDPEPAADVAAPVVSPVLPPAVSQAAAPGSQSPPAPKFTAGTELVLVDFVVTDKADRPVRGLSAKDFVVKEDGNERPIVEFQAFGGGAMAAAGGTALEPSARAAVPSPAAATVLLVDDGQLTPAQAARLRPALKALLAKLGARSGRLTLVAPGSNLSVTATLPAGAAELATAADRIAGQRRGDGSSLPVADAEALAIASGDLPVLARVAGRFAAFNPELNAEQATMIARERAIDVAHDARMRRETVYAAAFASFDWLASQPGRHSLVIVSGGFAHDSGDPKYYELVTRSLRVNAPIHFLDARGLQGLGPYKDVEFGAALGRNVDEGPTGWADAAAGSTTLADDTGGIIVGNTNDLAKGLGRLLDTMTTYYVIAYQPLANEKPGYRKIKVEVRTRGLQVRARRGYYSAPPARP